MSSEKRTLPPPGIPRVHSGKMTSVLQLGAELRVHMKVRRAAGRFQSSVITLQLIQARDTSSPLDVGLQMVLSRCAVTWAARASVALPSATALRTVALRSSRCRRIRVSLCTSTAPVKVHALSDADSASPVSLCAVKSDGRSRYEHAMMIPAWLVPPAGAYEGFLTFPIESVPLPSEALRG